MTIRVPLIKISINTFDKTNTNMHPQFVSRKPGPGFCCGLLRAEKLNNIIKSSYFHVLIKVNQENPVRKSI